MEAGNLKTKITVIVLSDNAAKYRAENLSASEYRLQKSAASLHGVPSQTFARHGLSTSNCRMSLQMELPHWVGLLTFSQTRTARPSVPSIGLLRTGVVMVRVLPSSLKERSWSVPVQAWFQEGLM